MARTGRSGRFQKGLDNHRAAASVDVHGGVCRWLVLLLCDFVEGHQVRLANRELLVSTPGW